MDNKKLIEVLSALKLHEYDIIEAYSNRYICNDRCEICFWKDGSIEIHPDEDRIINPMYITGIWQYDGTTNEYRCVFIRSSQLEQLKEENKLLQDENKRLIKEIDQLKERHKKAINATFMMVQDYERNFARRIICEEIRNECVYVAGTKEVSEGSVISARNLNEILNKIEKGE